MRGYVGQDIRSVELANGAPSNAIDLGNGTRAFQWSRISTDTTRVTAYTTTRKNNKGGKTTQTLYTGGDTTITHCTYTFLTAWDPQRKGWIVTSIRQPSLDCAVGNLN
jgi:hypothetical protein